MVHDAAAALTDAQSARDAGADLIEFRVDEVFAGEGDADGERLVLRLAADSPLPCIVTCRAASEGGGYDGDEMARVSLYERLGTAAGPGEHPPRFLDIELAAYTRSENIKQKINLAVDHPAQLRDLRTSLILSAHDFQGRPSDLTRRVLAMRAEPAAAVLKVAYRARSLRDNLELFDLVAESDRPMIALGMGEFGLMSRVLAPKFGAFLTFAALRAGTETAPGQPTVSDLLGMYRFRSVTSGTRVYGVIGWPVAHSFSPLVHNAGFASLGHDGVYVPMPVAPGYESLKATLGELVDHPRLDFAGCSVTLPHKENLVRYALERGWELDAASRAVGAGNTLVLERSGAQAERGRVLNTDVAGVVGPLARMLGGSDFTGIRAGVIGAGGAARGAVFALASAGAEVTVCNRTIDRARDVAVSIAGVIGHPIKSSDLHAAASMPCDVLINCTPVGMNAGPAPADSPVEHLPPRPGSPGNTPIAFDTVYTPRETPFLLRARAAGWRTIGGAEMFVTQAAAQFEAWTGLAAPRAIFDRFIEEAGSR